MDRQNYRPRIIDRKVEEYLSAFGAVCIEGHKWCGKTWTSAYHSKSEIYIGDPAGNFQNRQLAQLSPALVLEGETPRLIDEWQEVPPLWDAVRYKVDQTPQRGQFILTGSATPNHKGILHSGAGRIARLRMRPMSLYESGDSSGMVSLGKLYLTGKEVPPDQEKGVHWLTQSAEQGNRYARFLLDRPDQSPSVMLAVTRLLHHMGWAFQDNSLPKSLPGGIRIDRKRLAQIREKKIAMGHKPDDHEEYQGPSMTM